MKAWLLFDERRTADEINLISIAADSPSNRFQDINPPDFHIHSRVGRVYSRVWKLKTQPSHKHTRDFSADFCEIFVFCCCQTICLMPVCDPKPGALQSSSREYIKHSTRNTQAKAEGMQAVKRLLTSLIFYVKSPFCVLIAEPRDVVDKKWNKSNHQGDVLPSPFIWIIEAVVRLCRCGVCSASTCIR